MYLSWLTRATSITPWLSITSFSHCFRFEINLLCDPGDQIALHFNPRFSSSRIICNSFLANHWGKEEVNNTFPFEAKEPFQVTLCHPWCSWVRQKSVPHPITPPLWLCLLSVFLLCPDLLLVFTQLWHRHAELQQLSQDAALVFSLGFSLSPFSAVME